MTNPRVSTAAYAPLQGTFSVSTGGLGGPLGIFGGGAQGLTSAVAVTTAMPNTGMSLVSNESEPQYDPELAAQIVELAKAKPLAVFKSTRKLMDWLNNPQK